MLSDSHPLSITVYTLEGLSAFTLSHPTVIDLPDNLSYVDLNMEDY